MNRMEKIVNLEKHSCGNTVFKGAWDWSHNTLRVMLNIAFGYAFEKSITRLKSAFTWFGLRVV